jgi:hypothetical protein
MVLHLFSGLRRLIRIEEGRRPIVNHKAAHNNRGLISGLSLPVNSADSAHPRLLDRHAEGRDARQLGRVGLAGMLAISGVPKISGISEAGAGTTPGRI